MVLGWLLGGTVDKGHMLKRKILKTVLLRSRVRLIHSSLILEAGGNIGKRNCQERYECLPRAERDVGHVVWC